MFVGLGPWMAIVDRMYLKINPKMSEEERNEVIRQRLQNRYNEVQQSTTNVFQRKERALKMLAMNRYMFGKCILRVPRFCEDLYDDIPLPLSSCSPVDVDSFGPIRVEQVKFGQSLKGDMIPKREIQAASVKTTNSNSGLKRKNHFPFLKNTAPDQVPLLGPGSELKVSRGYDSVAASSRIK